MSGELWLKEDLANIILAAEASSQAAISALGGLAEDEEKLRLYRQGYRDALRTVALALGLVGKPESLVISGNRREWR